MKTKPNQTEYIASHTIFLVQYIGTVYRVHCVLTTFNAMQCNAIAIASAFESVYPNNKPSQANSIAYVALQLEFLLLLTMALEFHSFSQKCFARLSKSFEYEKLTLFFPSISLSSSITFYLHHKPCIQKPLPFETQLLFAQTQPNHANGECNSHCI